MAGAIHTLFTAVSAFSRLADGACLPHVYVVSGTNPSIRRMIVDSETGRFIRKGGGWTPEESEAALFDDFVALIWNCHRASVARPEILVRFNDDTRLDLHLPC